jgi:CHAT domain-containing protein/Tfp pilus assembly protein PilF
MYLKAIRVGLVVLAVTFMWHIESAAQVGKDKEDITAVIERLFMAYSKENIAEVMDCWAPTSSARADFEKFAATNFTSVDAIRIAKIQFTRWRIQERRASVRVRFEITSRDSKTGKVLRNQHVWNVEMVRDGDQWKLWERINSVEAFANALRQEKSPAERERMMTVEKELLVKDLVNRMNEHVLDLVKKGDFADARNTLEISFEIARFLNNKTYFAATYTYQGLAYDYETMYQKALEPYRKALALARDTKDQDLQSNVLLKIGSVYDSLNEYPEALENKRESLRIARRSRNRERIVNALGDIGTTYGMRGRYGEALKYFEASLRASRVPEDNSSRAYAFTNIGHVYEETGKDAAALERYQEALTLLQDLNDEYGQQTVLIGMGAVSKNLEKYDDALKFYDQALKIAREKTKDPISLGNVLNNIGEVYRATGKFDEAMEKYKESLEVSKNNLATTVIVLTNMGIVYFEQKKYDEALSKYREAAKLSEDNEQIITAFRSRYNIGVLLSRQNRCKEAVDEFRKAIGYIETVRSLTDEPFLKIGFLDLYVNVYAELATCLFDLKGDKSEIFKLSEQSKARTLVDLLQGSSVNVREVMTLSDRKTELRLTRAIVALSEEINDLRTRPNHEKDLRQLEQKLGQAQRSHDDFRQRLFVTRAKVRAVRPDFNPVTLKLLNETVFAAEPDLCLLSYLVGERTLLLAITRGDTASSPANVSVYLLPGDPEIADRVNELRLRYSNPSGVYKKLSQDLYKTLLGPAETLFADKKHLVIIPNKVLSMLPFHALTNSDGQALIKSHTVSYAPSATALMEMWKVSRHRGATARRRQMFAVGRSTFPDHAQFRDAPLPFAKEQSEAVAQLFGVSPLTDAKATESKVKAGMQSGQYLYLATHGIFNETDPLWSAILLGKDKGEDGFLYAREIVDMDLSADLVVLSSCDSGLTHPEGGEGILGMTWSLFTAGAKSSIVTQWKIFDDSTTSLMVDFFSQLKKVRNDRRRAPTKAEALRQAQLKMMESGKYEHPYYWAPFVLFGDWR